MGAGFDPRRIPTLALPVALCNSVLVVGMLLGVLFFGSCSFLARGCKIAFFCYHTKGWKDVFAMATQKGVAWGLIYPKWTIFG